jgi:hypothetical protein
MGSWDDYCAICAGPIPEACGYDCMYLTAQDGRSIIDYMSERPIENGRVAHIQCCDMIRKWFKEDFYYRHIMIALHDLKITLPLEEYHCQFFEEDRLKKDGKIKLLTNLTYLKKIWAKVFVKKSLETKACLEGQSKILKARIVFID